jgi:ABC-2 type transport system permease protein
MNSLRRLFAIVRKELMQLRRDRLTFAMIVGIPTIQLLLFGYAINMDVRNLDAAVVDQSGTHASRRVMQEIAHSQVVNVRYHLPGPAPVDELMRTGKISVAIVFPDDFDRRLARNESPAIQLMVDGSDPVILQAAQQLASIPLDAVAKRPVEVLTLYNPERKSAINTVPGLVGVILTMTMSLFTAVAIVRERERGNLELLITTPVQPVELMIGKVLPFVLIGLVQVSLVLGLGVLIFGVPVRGSLLDFYVAALTYIVAALSLGVFISTLTKTQFQAMQAAFFTFLPQILLSGFMFPYAGMPKVAQWIAEVMPLTHFIRLVRGILLRDAGLADLWQELAILGLFSVVALSIAVARFRKRLD